MAQDTDVFTPETLRAIEKLKRERGLPAGVKKQPVKIQAEKKQTVRDIDVFTPETLRTIEKLKREKGLLPVAEKPPVTVQPRKPGPIGLGELAGEAYKRQWVRPLIGKAEEGKPEPFVKPPSEKMAAFAPGLASGRIYGELLGAAWERTIGPLTEAIARKALRSPEQKRQGKMQRAMWIIENPGKAKQRPGKLFGLLEIPHEEWLDPTVLDAEIRRRAQEELKRLQEMGKQPFAVTPKKAAGLKTLLDIAVPIPGAQTVRLAQKTSLAIKGLMAAKKGKSAKAVVETVTASSPEVIVANNVKNGGPVEPVSQFESPSMFMTMWDKMGERFSRYNEARKKWIGKRFEFPEIEKVVMNSDVPASKEAIDALEGLLIEHGIGLAKMRKQYVGILRRQQQARLIRTREGALESYKKGGVKEAAQETYDDFIKAAKEDGVNPFDMMGIHVVGTGEKARMEAMTILGMEAEIPKIKEILGKFPEKYKEELLQHLEHHHIFDNASEAARWGTSNRLRAFLETGFPLGISDIDVIGLALGPKIGDAISKTLRKRERVVRFLAEVMNFHRGGKSSGEFSGTLKQGATMVMRAPQKLPEFFFKQVASFASKKYAKKVDAAMRSEPEYHVLRNKMELEYADIEGVTAGEEAITGHWAKLADLKVKEGRGLLSRYAVSAALGYTAKGAGKVVEMSGRSMSVYLNLYRHHLGKVWYRRQLKEYGLKAADHPDVIEHMKNMGNGINILSGRGPTMGMGKQLGQFFYSLRFTTSRWFADPRAAFYSVFGKTKTIRSFHLRELGVKLAWWGGMANLANAYFKTNDIDAEMGGDPRNSQTFLKLKSGNNVADMSGGFGPQYRLWASWILSGANTFRRTAGLEPVPVRIDPVTKKPLKADPVITASYYLMYKQAPTISTITALFRGRSPVGGELTLGGFAMMASPAPIFAETASDLSDGLLEMDGEAWAYLLLDGLGASSTVYPWEKVAYPKKRGMMIEQMKKRTKVKKREIEKAKLEMIRK